MTLVCDELGTSVHTGSTIVGPVSGTLGVTTQSFFTIESKKIMVELDTMIIPLHKYDPGPPELFHSHAFPPSVFANNYFFIEGNRICLKTDNYSADPTEIDGTGSNTFFEVN